MKVLPLGITLAFGLAIGWMAHEPFKNHDSVAKPAEVVHRARPLAARISTPAIPSFATSELRTRTLEFRRWINAMDDSNWREYMDFALSDEATNHNFLATTTVESLEFLHKLGEVAGAEPIVLLRERNLTFAAAEVMDGWANIAPEEAFAWITEPEQEVNRGEDQEIFAKAAGAMMNIDFDKVWANTYQVKGAIAQEFVRRNGFEETDRKLQKYWNQPNGGEQFNQQLYAQCDGWEEIVSVHIRSQTPANIDELEYWQTSLTQRYGQWLSMDINPGVRECVEARMSLLNQTY